MRKANKVDKSTGKNDSGNKGFTPDPVQIIWNKDSKKPTKHSPEDDI